ncbi:MAG: hypothetical protein ABIG87_02845 [Patescibacteria group bacterium]
MKKVNLLTDKMSKNEKDYVAIILEEVRSNFSVFGEVLSGFGEKLEHVRQKGDATFEEVGRIKGELVLIKDDIVEMKGELVLIKDDIVGIKGEMKKMNGRLDNIASEVSLIRNDIDNLLNLLTEKADIDYVKKLEMRLRIVEKHLKLSTV